MTNSVGKRLHWRLLFSEVDFNAIDYAGIKHQAANPSSRQRRLESIKRRSSTIFQYYETPLPTHEIQKAKVRYMPKNDVIEDRKGVRLPAAYAIVTSAELKHDELQINTNDLIHKQAKNRSAEKIHVQYDYLLTEMNSLGKSCPSMEQFKLSFQFHYDPVLYVICINQVWQNIWVKDL